MPREGAAGIIDISPFPCMNGIVCEAIYPRVSRDLGVYMELARSYQKKRG